MKSEIILHDHSVTFETNEPVVEKDGLVVNIVGGIGPRGTKGDKGDTPEKGVDYFTEEDIDEIADAAAGKVHVPTNVSELENDAGYLTEHQDISGKADKSELPTMVSELENDAGYLTAHQDISQKADKSELPVNVSELVNDAGYLTEHQDISQKADKSEIPTRVGELENDVGYLTEHQDISNKADKSEIPTRVSELENDTGYITGYTETDPTVPAWAKNTVKPSYTAAEVGALPDNTHIPSTTAELENDAGFITAEDLPVNVSELVNDAGYLTQHQDISGKADKSEIPTKVSELTNDSGYLTAETDPTVPAWARAAQKPEYTAAEVGATTEQQVSEMIADAIPEVPVQDVQVNGASILQNGVANIPVASYSNGQASLGLVKAYGLGIYVGEDGEISIKKASDRQIKTGSGESAPVVAAVSHQAAFYGLAKAAGDTTQSQSSNAVGAYTDEAKAAIQTMLDVPAKSDIPDVLVQDVQVDGVSVLNNGVASIEAATSSKAGVVIVNPSYGMYMTNRHIVIQPQNDATIKNGNWSYGAITPSTQHKAAFYGLAKAAGDTTQSQSDNAVGLYTNEAKTAIQTMLDVPSKSDIPDVPVQDVQLNGTSVLNDGVANIPVAGENFGVIKVLPAYGLTTTSAGSIATYPAGSSNIKIGGDGKRPLVPMLQHESTFYGLAKAAGDTSQSVSSNAVGTYTDEAKTAIQNMLDVPSNTDLAQAISDVEEKIQHMYICSAAEYNSETGVPTVANPDSKTFYLVPSSEGSPNLYIEWVYLNNAWERFGSATIDLSNYVQFSDYATANKAGVVRVLTGSYGLNMSGGQIIVARSTDAYVKAGTNSYNPIVPMIQHEATFYGLAKAAGHDEKDSTLPLGQYTAEAQSAIRSMIGAANADDIVAVQDTQPTSEDNKIWLPETPPAGVEVPTVGEMNTALAEKVDMDNVAPEYDSTATYLKGNFCRHDGKLYFAKVHISTAEEWNSEHWTETTLTTYANNALQRPGIIGITPVWSGVRIDNYGGIYLSQPNVSLVKQGSDSDRAVLINRQHWATFYGLAKAAGHDEKDSTEPFGTYTDEAKTAIRTMLGTVGTEDYASTSAAGIVRIDNNLGLYMNGTSHAIGVNGAAESEIKIAHSTTKPIIPARQHVSTFYGLARAAGDTSQSLSSNDVGTYTDEAKTAIQTMLGIDLAGLASQVEIPLVETVAGTVVSITGQPNTRYNCGEVTTMTITPPESGSIDVIFTSGSTAAVLSVPSTVKFPEWFDATALEVNTVYEILITDGVYGSVMSWAL